MNSPVITGYNWNGHSVRVIFINNRPWFVAKDVSTILGYKNHIDCLKRHCRDDIAKHDVVDSAGRRQSSNIITESDVYRLVMQSKMQQAIEFEKWVIDEVIPNAVHQKKAMLVQTELDLSSPTKPDTQALAIPQSYPDALRALADQFEKTEKLIQINNELAPKAELLDDITGSSDLLRFREVAKILKKHKLGGNGLISTLIDIGVLYRYGGRPVPKQVHINQGRFQLKESVYYDSKDRPKIAITTLVTQKGVAYIDKVLSKYAIFSNSILTNNIQLKDYQILQSVTEA